MGKQIDIPKRTLVIPGLLIIESDEMCLACFKPNNNHSREDKQNCSKKLVEMGIMRFCGLCGLTKPAQRTHDRCGKCGEKYSFSND